MADPRPFIKACLNGARQPGSHPALPTGPRELAADAKAVAREGAAAIHIHPRDAEGRETLAPEYVGEAVGVVAAAVPSLAVGVTTGLWIDRDPAKRLEAVEGWKVLPAFASVNFSEDGAADLARLLIDMGVEVEAGLWSPDDAGRLAESGLGDQCIRYLIEPTDRELEAARATAQGIERVLDERGLTAVPRLLHGGRATAWPLLRDALARGYQTRIGLEDTFTLEDGTEAEGNAALMRAAMAMAAG